MARGSSPSQLLSCTRNAVGSTSSMPSLDLAREHDAAQRRAARARREATARRARRRPRRCDGAARGSTPAGATDRGCRGCRRARARPATAHRCACCVRCGCPARDERLRARCPAARGGCRSSRRGDPPPVLVRRGLGVHRRATRVVPSRPACAGSRAATPCRPPTGGHDITEMGGGASVELASRQRTTLHDEACTDTPQSVDFCASSRQCRAHRHEMRVEDMHGAPLLPRRSCELGFPRNVRASTHRVR